MSVQVEKLEKSMAKLTITVEAAKFDAAVDSAYQKNKGKIALPGFRKGKAPRAMIEKMYGTGVFFEDAANELIPEAYETAAKESELEIVAQPEIEVTQMDKGTDFIFTATVAIKPEVTLGDYKGIEVEKKEAEVSEEEITAEIDKAREANSRLITIEDRATEDGDTVIIDFDGYVDGKQFEGGYAEDYTLVLGSHSFIDNFEDQLVGKNLGEDVEVNVTFPEEYHVDELKGKPALFKVKIKEIQKKELPELDDDFAKDVSEFDTLAEYKEDVKKKLTEKKEKEARTAKENAAVDKAIENAQMDIPELMTKTECRQMMDDFSRRMQQQGLSMEQYFQFTGQSMDKMMEDMKPQALKRIQTRLVLEKVAEAENIQPSEEEITEEIQKMADAYKMEADKIREAIGESGLEQMKKDMAVQKAVTVIADAAVEVEKAADAE